MLDFDFKEKIPEPHWLVDGLIPLGHLVFCNAQSGVGKSLLADYLATCVVFGGMFLGLPTQGGEAVIIDQDQAEDTLKTRLLRYGVGIGGRPKHSLVVYSQENLSLEDGSLVQAINRHPHAVFVLIDTLHSVVGGLNPDSTKDMAKLNRLRQECLTTGKTIWINHHISEKRGMSADELMSCAPHGLPMGNSAISQQADTYYIVASPDRGSVLERLYLRPVSKRQTIPGRPRILRLRETKDSLLFTLQGSYVAPEPECEQDILSLFTEHPEPRPVNKVYSDMGQKHGIINVRLSLKSLRDKGKLQEDKTKPAGMFVYRLPDVSDEQLPMASILNKVERQAVSLSVFADDREEVGA